MLSEAAKNLDPDSWMNRRAAEELSDGFEIELADGSKITKAQMIEAEEILDEPEPLLTRIRRSLGRLRTRRPPEA